MKTIAIAYITVLAVMGVMDAAWLSFATSRLYRPGIGGLMAEKPVALAALVFYLLYAAGVTYLLTLPGLIAGSAGNAAWRGAVFGLVAYGTYDLTSLAIMRNWPLNVTIIDMLWGAIITATAAGISVFFTKKFS
ncbi:MAG: DUF2177 family protein [Acidocella sp.]|nr:DUF2177 family protein [Acidocella sp.]